MNINADFIRKWLFSHWLVDNPETRGEVDCMLSNKENWKYIEDMGEHYRNQRWGEDDELDTDDMGVDDSLGFALTGLIEGGHEGPHQDGCPYAPGGRYNKTGFLGKLKTAMEGDVQFGASGTTRFDLPFPTGDFGEEFAVPFTSDDDEEIEAEARKVLSADRPTCQVEGCQNEAQWALVNSVQWDPIHGPIHSGEWLVPERPARSEWCEFCDDHARSEADPLMGKRAAVGEEIKNQLNGEIRLWKIINGDGSWSVGICRKGDTRGININWIYRGVSAEEADRLAQELVEGQGGTLVTPPIFNVGKRASFVEIERDQDDQVGEFHCSDCGRHVGWDVDADDDGRAVGEWTSYWISGEQKLCEDCADFRGVIAKAKTADAKVVQVFGDVEDGSPVVRLVWQDEKGNFMATVMVDSDAELQTELDYWRGQGVTVIGTAGKIAHSKVRGGVRIAVVNPPMTNKWMWAISNVYGETEEGEAESEEETTEQYTEAIRNMARRAYPVAKKVIEKEMPHLTPLEVKPLARKMATTYPGVFSREGQFESKPDKWGFKAVLI